MRHPSLTVIQDEHQALAAMLRSMQLMVRQAAADGRTPDFGVLRAMLLYVDEYPERLHHPKESELLFPKIRARCPDLADVLARLDADHERGEAAIRQLEHLLLAYEVMGDARREAFDVALERYIQSYLAHMGAEEMHILPAARKHLTDEDWAELDAAFAANRDPLTGHPASTEFEPLFRKIVNEAPAPIGLGGR